MRKLLEHLRGTSSFQRLTRTVRTAFAREPNAPEVDNQNRMYDKHTLAVMKRVLRSDSNCIDVGCHEGVILKDILRIAPTSAHFAFEPIPGMYERLCRKFGKIPNLRICDYALSDTAGTTTFQHVVSNPGYSGLRRRSYDRPHEQIQEITVKTDLLDNLVPRDVPVHFIKVDVEGGELQVFKGAVETIRQNRPVIIFEHGLGGADYYGTTPEDMYDLLAGQCGLRLFLMSAWLESSGKDALSRGAFCEQFAAGTYYFMAAP